MKRNVHSKILSLGVVAGAAIFIASCSSGNHSRSSSSTAGGKDVSVQAEGTGLTYLASWSAPALKGAGRVAVEANGNVLVSDPQGNAVHEFSNAGQYLGAIAVKQPLGVAVDATGRIIVGSGNGVVAIDKATKTQTALCTGAGAFAKPNDIAIEPDSGMMWIADSANNRVVMCSAEGVYVASVGSLGSGDGQLNFPAGVAIDPASKQAWVVDSGNSRVEAFDLNGNYVGKVSAPELTRPQGIAVTAGHVFVTDVYQNAIAIFNKDGSLVKWFGTTGDVAGAFLLPSDVTIDAYNRMLVTSFATKRVEVFGLDQYRQPTELGK